MYDPNCPLAIFNAKNRIMMAIVNIPNSNLCRVLYGFGFGASGIGVISSVDGKVLALTGVEKLGEIRLIR